LEAYNKSAASKIKAAKETHTEALRNKKRLSRMVSDYKKKKDDITRCREEEYNRKKEEAARKIEEEKSQRRKAVAKAREEEREREEELERIRREEAAEVARLEQG
jgi:translation initiation factor 3 subunit A